MMKNQPTRLPQLEDCERDLSADEFGSKAQLLADIGQGDQPVIVMLTCSELGFIPDALSNANPGEVMVVQNPGGMAPGAETQDGGSFLESVIYGLSYATVRHLVVCGHSECTIPHFLVEEETQDETNPFRVLMQTVAERCKSTYADRPLEEWFGIVVQENVLQQLANLRSHAPVQSRLRDGNLRLYGWIRNDKTSVIIAYNPVVGQFCD